MEDGAALLQFEGSGVFTEVLSHGIAHRLQLPKRDLQINQLGLSPLQRDNTARAMERELDYKLTAALIGSVCT